ncbi:hypothetical protein FB45DRAFT_976315 [Roridomyces roridus]|uniref:FAD/NAD(P)-binding domain-containing protein n=1 Tax=Roridomyces roridus TaxID=1738132 RepID=A0AAD7FVN3_9AGAR|nr:hypothetical protein FB45DRAFT_976315 [Roridomyces roridus]
MKLDEKKFPRLSRPVSMMEPEYDVVVVGSGYGGGVAASRMARAGKSVAVLELGKERWPGEFPSDLKTAATEVHISGNAGKFSGPLEDVQFGKSTGLYHLILGEGQNAFVGNGLGGTSLLNANIFLHADKRTLQLSEWPAEIRQDPACLDPYYARAAEMLQPTPYPQDYPALKKLQVLEKQAELLGFKHNFYRPPQTTFFHEGLNNAGVQMHASTGSGQDCTGINDGSKHSTLMNYLPDAWNRGAEIFCECEVRYVRKDPNSSGYIVFFAWHGDGRDAFKDDFYSTLMWVRAKELCFLGAGALATTEILLRSKAHGLQMSRLVGQKVSGNGDILAFGYNTDDIVNGIGSEHPSPSNPCGPTITGVIDNRGPETSPNVLDGYVIEEGAVPQAIAPLFQTMLEALPAARKYSPRHIISALQSRFGGAYAKSGSIQRTQTYLIMSHDSNEGLITMQGDKSYLQFLGVGRTEHVSKLNQVLTNATGAVGGTMQEEITVHPLGGAILSSDGTGRNGGTNHMGQVFVGDGEEVHEGIICVDGSVVPTALGVNPFATITALAERSVDQIAKQRGMTFDESKNGRLDLFGRPKFSSSLTYASSVVPEGAFYFTEIMGGHIHIGDDISDYVLAASAGKGAASAMEVYVGVTAASTDDLIKGPDHLCSVTGTVSCGALSPDPMLVLRGGRVQFFTIDEDVSDGARLIYDLTLLSTSGETYLLKAYKQLDSSLAFSPVAVWRATTALYTTILRADGKTVVGRGRLRLSWRNFAEELLTLRASDKVLSVRPLFQFTSFFARAVASFFLAPLSRLEYPDLSHSGYLTKTPPARTSILTARDGVQIQIKVWDPLKGAKQRKYPLLMIPGASVDDSIFSLPTIPENAVEYFTGQGYTVYIPTLRYGRTRTAMKGDTAFDARLDVEAAFKYVREEESGKKVLVICHCVGSMSTSMALLDGNIPVDWIQGLLASQIFFKQRFGKFNGIKANTSILPNVYKFFAGPWYPIISTPTGPSLFQFLIDQVLRFYPVGSRAEHCTSTVCHRCSLIFGRLWNHDNLTHATHAHLGNFFGGIHMGMLTHLMRTGHVGQDLDDAERDLLTDENVKRLGGVKMTFVSGGDNVVFSPVSTSLCYDFMRERFGDANGLYRRVVAEGYGHLDFWMGKKSRVDVYPVCLENLEWFEEE